MDDQDDPLLPPPSLEAILRAETAADRQLAQAMRDVPIPAGLRQRVHDRLAQDRRQQRRNRWLRAGLATAAALLLGLVAWEWWNPPPTRLDAEAIARVFDQRAAVAPETVEADFRRQGVAMVAPHSFHFAWLVSYDRAEFQGRRVARLTFVRGDAMAEVYVLPTAWFRVPADDEAWQAVSSHNLVTIQPAHDPRFLFLIVTRNGRPDDFRPDHDTVA